LFSLVIDRSEVDASFPAYGIQLVHENDAGSLLFCLLEKVPDAGGAHTDKHLDEITAVQREERDLGLAGHGPRQQCFACAGWPNQQDTFGDLCAKLLVMFWILEEIHHLPQFHFRFITAGHILESHPGGLVSHEFRPALAKTENRLPGGSELASQKHPQSDHGGNGQAPTQQELR
jgi:hypothetical protein